VRKTIVSLCGGRFPVQLAFFAQITFRK
jgi:hypothetical protein